MLLLENAKYCFYLRMFFDLIDVALVKSYIVYAKFSNDIYLLNFKIVVAKALIGRYHNHERSFTNGRPSMQKPYEPSIPREVRTHMPSSRRSKWDANLCKNEDSDHKTFVYCQTCGLHLCLTKVRNCFLKHHL